jgi:hypothetical protein
MTDLLSKTRELNTATYSAYLKVIDPPPDTTIFDAINKFDILLAIAAQLKRGRTLTMQVTMWNNSYNPQRLRYDRFYLLDENGKKYTALKSSKIKPEILDQEVETKLTLNFPAPKARIEKFVYENKPHYSEKRFF